MTLAAAFMKRETMRWVVPRNPERDRHRRAVDEKVAKPQLRILDMASNDSAKPPQELGLVGCDGRKLCDGKGRSNIVQMEVSSRYDDWWYGSKERYHEVH